MPVQVALTGGTGFIGSHITRALRHAGISVKSLTRQPRADAGQLNWVPGELHDPASLQNLCHHCDAVIHCAGVVRGNHLNDFLHVNLHGTEHLLAAIKSQANPTRLLFISSLAARQPTCSWYAQSKYRAEQAIVNAGLAPAPAIFRPAAVYGPGDKEMQAMFKTMRRGFLFTPAGVKSRIGILHVDDLIAAVLLWLKNTTLSGCYELDDGTENGFDWDAFIHTGEQVWQRKIRKIPIPLRLLHTLAEVNLYCARLLAIRPCSHREK